MTIQSERQSAVKKFIRRLIPSRVQAARICLKILESDYGYKNSIETQSSVDGKGNPIPWFAYPAIEYIKQLDLSEKVIFEYGSGNSTLFWETRAKRVMSIEHDEKWFNKMKTLVSPSTELKLISDNSYPDEILKIDENFDVIIIDGRCRYDCATAAVKKLKNGGIIILDDSDWFPNTTRVLREANLIQVDLSGFAPINLHIHTTSFFLHRDFDFKPIYNEQPQNIIGSIKRPFSMGDVSVKND